MRALIAVRVCSSKKTGSSKLVSKYIAREKLGHMDTTKVETHQHVA